MKYMFDGDEIQIEEVSTKFQEKKKKKGFYKFYMDNEALTNNPGAEAIKHLSDAKKLECLRKYLTVQKSFLKIQYHNTIQCTSRMALQLRRACVDSKTKLIN